MRDHSRRPLGFTALIACWAIFVPAMAGAVSFRATPYALGDADLQALEIGHEILIGVRISDYAGVYGLGASVHGYSTDVLQFVRGEATASILVGFCIPAAICIAKQNYAGSWYVRGPADDFPHVHSSGALTLSETSIGVHGPRVLFAQTADLSPASQSTVTFDPGLGWRLTEYEHWRDDHALLRFRIVGSGSTVIHVGTGYAGDGAVMAGGVLITGVDSPIQINVIPEPNAALLIAVGLVGLRAQGRRCR
jgi:hypothetical protein